MKNVVIRLQKDGKQTIYIALKKRTELLAPIQHKLRIKCAIYNSVVSSYHPDMDFTNALNAGWTIVEDNRSMYIHDIKIVPAYSKKNKDQSKQKMCNYCGQAIND